jgi:hypothetical protein
MLILIAFDEVLHVEFIVKHYFTNSLKISSEKYTGVYNNDR